MGWWRWPLSVLLEEELHDGPVGESHLHMQGAVVGIRLGGTFGTKAQECHAVEAADQRSPQNTNVEVLGDVEVVNGTGDVGDGLDAWRVVHGCASLHNLRLHKHHIQ